jgi:formate hydrogenlyase transcriptional activator
MNNRIRTTHIDDRAVAALEETELEPLVRRSGNGGFGEYQILERGGLFRHPGMRQDGFQGIVGQSRSLRQLLHQVRGVAPTDATVLVLGETGTGKELIVYAIHNLSARSRRAFAKVNCAALPESLIESELFGYKKGAFTGANGSRIGRFEYADGGTIFLDEIGDLPLGLQAKLLRILQDGQFERLGDSSTKEVDVRVIAATNRDLEEEVRRGEFREDLYYRLNVFPVALPPLRERSEDIPLLVQHFVRMYSERLGKPVTIIPQETLEALKRYSWPGNVRQLENLIMRAIILASGPILEMEENFGTDIEEPKADKKPLTLKQMERSLIREALESSNWVIEGRRGAAVLLDIAPSTLRERIRKYGLSKPASSLQ